MPSAKTLQAQDDAETKRPKRIADQVADQILEKISDGIFLPGDRLPGERQLAESMSVSRVSVRAALQKLKTRGYLRAVQGAARKSCHPPGSTWTPR